MIHFVTRQPEPLDTGMWFRDGVACMLNATAQAASGPLAYVEPDVARVYLAGYRDALLSLAQGFGLEPDPPPGPEGEI